MSKEQSSHMDLLLDHTIRTSDELQQTKEELKATRRELELSGDQEKRLIGRIEQLKEKQSKENNQLKGRNEELSECVMLLGCCAHSTEAKSIGAEIFLRYLKEENYKHYSTSKKKEILHIKRKLFNSQEKHLPLGQGQEDQVLNQLTKNLYSLGVPANYTERFSMAMDKMVPKKLYEVFKNFYLKVKVDAGQQLKVAINIDATPTKESVYTDINGQTVSVHINHPQASPFVRIKVLENETSIKGITSPVRSKTPQGEYVSFDDMKEEHIYGGYVLLKIRHSKKNVSCKTQ